MTFRTLLFLCFFCLQSHIAVYAANELPDRIPSISESSVRVQQHSKGSSTRQHALQKNETTGRISFATRSGFVLLRKEDILSLSVHKLYAGLLLHYWSRGVVRTVHCQGTLNSVQEALGDCFFWQVSRSALVNLDEVVEYVGTKRDAHLVLTDGSTVKVSRNRAGAIYDWVAAGKIG